MVEGERNKRVKGEGEGRMKEGRSVSLILKKQSLNRGENIVGKIRLCKPDPRKMRKNK